jgi:CRISPR-associated protein Csh2
MKKWRKLKMVNENLKKQAEATLNDVVQTRREIVFLYDAKGTNPNGDPNDENRPRIEEQTGKNLSTDVRLKRTSRDYLYETKGEEILVRQTDSETVDGGLKDGKARVADFGKKPEEVAKNVLEQCIDVRLFGGVLPMKDTSVKFTGSAQFKFGKSLNPVTVRYTKGTGAFASKDGAKQQTFREEYTVDYSLLNYYGIVNENNAKKTQLKNSDVDLLLEAMWEGTKNLHSRSKVGQTPRLLLEVEYATPHFHIGELNEDIKMVVDSDLTVEQVTDVKDYVLDLTDWFERVAKYAKHIKQVRYAVNDRVQLSHDIVAEFNKLGIEVVALNVSDMDKVEQKQFVGV